MTISDSAVCITISWDDIQTSRVPVICCWLAAVVILGTGSVMTSGIELDAMINDVR
jgi:hypothetical protein